jgi:hypothetical protein
MNPYVGIVISIVTALATVGAAWLTVRAGKKKTETEATQTLTQIALSLVEPLKAEMEELRIEMVVLETEIDALKKENLLLHRWAQLLFTQVSDLGQDPIRFDEVRQKWDD